MKEGDGIEKRAGGKRKVAYQIFQSPISKMLYALMLHPKKTGSFHKNLTFTFMEPITSQYVFVS